MARTTPRTLVTFHAHPDDEAIATGGVMAKAASEGHRVVLVVATRGELGEVVEGVLRPGEELWQRRVEETREAARILGVARVEFLGFVDSGMMGEATNDAPESFWRAPVDEAARRLAAILHEEEADVLTIYDEIGGYGHPDHIQVHRVGRRAAEVAGTRVIESTINRDHILRMMQAAGDEFSDNDRAELEAQIERGTFGMPESVITTFVDVRDFVDLKRKAMAAHASQIPSDSFFLAMPDDAFREGFGVEWFIDPSAPAGAHGTSIWADES
jgi:LmbE family N-acetylglucosaminyl deacetylase